MSDYDGVSGIADSSKPNAGRIYDYILGGNHNFDVDRQTAQMIIGVTPFAPQLFRTIRWFFGEAVRRLLDEGFDKFVDFASGLPTMDHIHEIAPKGTKIIYSDIDPVTVAYGQEIIGENPDVKYMHCDAGEPEKVLHSDFIEEFFDGDRKVALGFNGITWFIPDESVRHFFEVSYEWAAPGSKVYTCDNDATEVGEEAKKFLEIYNKIGVDVYPRPLKTLEEMMHPWKVSSPGWRPLEEWVDLDTKVAQEVMKGWSGGGFKGAILEK
jgi:hypothetical protein